MAPILYMAELSPPCRSVMLTAKALGLSLEYKHLNLAAGEHLTQEFRKINPQHTIPVLDDNGVIITESHAIMTYLVTKYGKDDSLYPKDPVKRAMVDQRMYFDTGAVFPLIRQIVGPIIKKKTKSVPEELVAQINDAYGFLEKFLEGKQYITGDNVTIADYCLVATVISLLMFLNVEDKHFPNVTAWLNRAQHWANYGENDKGVKEFYKLLKTLMQ